MANALYVAFRNGVLGSHSTRVDLDADTIKIVLTDHGGDTPAPTTDDFYNDISGGTVGSLSSALTGKTIGTVAAGVFDSDNVTFSAVSGNSVESVNMLKDTGVTSTSDLIAYYDTATGLPVTPNGGDIIVAPASGGWFTF